MRHFILIITCLFLLSPISPAQKAITNEAIWSDGLFATESVPGFNFLNDGRHYTRLVDGTIKKYDITTGEWVSDLFESGMLALPDFHGPIERFSFSEDEGKLLLESETEQIYRRSYLAKYHVYDLQTKQAYTLFDEGKVMNATFSPDGSKVAYVYENDLYYFDLVSGITLPITDDGTKNSIINGATDWVYEEEFSIVKAFWWSPDSKTIAFLKFDESDVREFTMTYYEDARYPRYETFKYPKVGEKNASIQSYLYDLTKEKLDAINLGDMDDVYIPRVQWTQNPSQVVFYKMNRHQNELQLILVDANDSSARVILNERNPYFIDIDDDLTFLPDGSHFIWTSEQSGYNQIYKYQLDGSEVTAVTAGTKEVTAFYGVDEKNGLIYYQRVGKTPMDREIYEVDLNGTEHRMLTTGQGVHNANFSSTFDYYTLTSSNINTPQVYRVIKREGEEIRMLEDNQHVKNLQNEYGVQPLEFFSFQTIEGIPLNGWIIKPGDFDPSRQYPVFMYQYSGPGSQQVMNSWRGTNYWWFQMLAQEGYIIACVDGRGTGGRGEAFKKMTYMNLGHYETIDQIEAAKYLGSLNYVDDSRIGIFGWSYGGYMSSLCILKGSQVFATAIAVAPVTNWKWYDTIYTERYMRTEEENPNGYKQNSPVYFADRLKGKYLLVHGSTDDNVHFQNSMEMANALIAANKQFDQYVYPNRNHGIYGDNARLHLYNKMTLFLNETLMHGGLEKTMKP